MRSTTRIAGILAATLAVMVPTAAQETPKPDLLLDRMVGKWVLKGTMGSTQTTHDVDAEWVLNREYIRMHEVSREKNPQGGPAYEAIVFIGRNQKSGEYMCLWLDTTSGEGLSNGVIGRGKPAGNSIPFIFKYPSGDGFHTTFIYDEKTQSWQWIMDNESGGKLEPFFRAKLTKQ